MSAAATSSRAVARPWWAFVALVSLIFAAAAGPVAIRFAQLAGLPSVFIIAARLTLASGLMAPFVWRWHRPVLQQLSARDWGWALLAGSFHAGSLLLLFFSLENTSVLVNGVLRRTSPLWVLLLEILVLHTVFSRRVWAGVALTLVGTIVVGLGSSGGASAGARPLLGAVLALLTAFVSAGYLVVGRRIRTQLPFLPYSWIVFTAAALIGWLIVLFRQVPVTGYGWSGFGWILVVTLLTQILGHIPMNAALHHFTATFVSVSTQVAVILGAIFAFFLLAEVPTLLQVAGSVVILAGIFLVIKR